MEDINRRAAMALGLTGAAATPLFALATPAVAAMYRPDEGNEYHPGVRVVMLGKRDSMISAYKQVQLSDTVFQPGSTWPDDLRDETEDDCQTSVDSLSPASTLH